MPMPIAQLLRIIAPAIHMQTDERKIAGTHAVDGLKAFVVGLDHVVDMSLVQAMVLDHFVCGWIVCECVIKHLHVVRKRGDQEVRVIGWTLLTSVATQMSTCCQCGWSDVVGGIKPPAPSA